MPVVFTSDVSKQEPGKSFSYEITVLNASLKSFTEMLITPDFAKEAAFIEILRGLNLELQKKT